MFAFPFVFFFSTSTHHHNPLCLCVLKQHVSLHLHVLPSDHLLPPPLYRTSHSAMVRVTSLFSSTLASIQSRESSCLSSCAAWVTNILLFTQNAVLRVAPANHHSRGHCVWPSLLPLLTHSCCVPQFSDLLTMSLCFHGTAATSQHYLFHCCCSSACLHPPLSSAFLALRCAMSVVFLLFQVLSCQSYSFPR